MPAPTAVSLAEHVHGAGGRRVGVDEVEVLGDPAVAAGYDDGRSRNCRPPYDDSPLDPGHAERVRELSGVTVVKTETIPCPPNEFLEFVLDIEGYAKVDDKIAPVLWSRRDGDVVQFACLPKIAGLCAGRSS